MSSVRVVFAEVEGSDEMVRSVIGSFVDRVHVAAAVPLAIAPVAVETPAAALPAPETEPQAETVKPARPRTVGQKGSQRLAMTEADVVAELRKGERTIKHLMDSTGLTYAYVFGALKRLEGHGAITKSKIEGGVTNVYRLKS